MNSLTGIMDSLAGGLGDGLGGLMGAIQVPLIATVSSLHSNNSSPVRGD